MIRKNEQILYVNRGILSKSARGRQLTYPYNIVEIDERLRYGKVKVSCYVFDIMCAGAPDNRTGTDVIDEKDIKVFDCDAVLNDLKEGDIHRKYWYDNFLRINYPYSVHSDHIDNTAYVYWENKVIGSYLYRPSDGQIPEWCNGSSVLYDLDIVLNYMIENSIDTDKAFRLLEIVHEPDVTMTVEEHLYRNGIIIKD